MSGSFAQLLRYTAPADTRSTIVRLRSAGTASLAFEQNSALKKECIIEKKMKDNEIGQIPIKGLLGQGLLKEIARSKKWGC